MTGPMRRAAAVLAALAGVLAVLGLGVTAAGPVSGAPLAAGQVVAAQAPADAQPAVTAVQTVADREVTRAVVATRTIFHGVRGWSAATLEVFVAALLLLCIAAGKRFSPWTDSVARRVGAPRSPPGLIRS